MLTNLEKKNIIVEIRIIRRKIYPVAITTQIILIHISFLTSKFQLMIVLLLGLNICLKFKLLIGLNY